MIDATAIVILILIWLKLWHRQVVMKQGQANRNLKLNAFVGSTQKVIKDQQNIITAQASYITALAQAKALTDEKVNEIKELLPNLQVHVSETAHWPATLLSPDTPVVCYNTDGDVVKETDKKLKLEPGWEKPQSVVMFQKIEDARALIEKRIGSDSALALELKELLK